MVCSVEGHTHSDAKAMDSPSAGGGSRKQGQRGGGGVGADVMAGMGGGGAGRTAWLARRSWVLLRG